MPAYSLRVPVIRAAVVAATAARGRTALAVPAADHVGRRPPAPRPLRSRRTGPRSPGRRRPGRADRASRRPTGSRAAQQTAAASPGHTAAAGGSAMNRALGKVGAPYRWGATGPNAFDCSGLVNWAYKSAGVSLPRTSRALSKVGTPVAKADLRPGDLVFFYRPVSHVGIYVGNGKIVHASSRQTPVKVSDMGRMTFNSARRV